MKSNTKTAKIVGIGLFTAIVVVLQLVASAIKFGPFSITLCLAPIVIGAALYGLGAGAWLGCAFGVAVLISGDAGLFLSINPFGTVVTVLAKGTIAGLGAAAAYKLTEKLYKKPVYEIRDKNGDVIGDIYRKTSPTLVSTVIAGIASPVLNTGVFMIGCYLFFQDWLVGAFGTKAFATVFAGLVSANFAVELAINLVLATAIVKIIEVGKKQLKK